MTRKAKNILFIMYDQLRWDYLSCTGHPTLDTPNFDRVAQMGVLFDRCYVQSPICGASRMSTYTGRYCHSHGSHFNGLPLRLGEWTMGDHLRNAGMGCYLIGKTHMKADKEGMARLGMSETSDIGLRQAECGFDVVIRDDGMMTHGPDGYYFDDHRSPYNQYLWSKGYDSENPWHDNANAAHDAGKIASGFLMQNARKPANVREEDSETPWLTDRTLEWLQDRGDDPWCAHVSYIKPHWPYIVPAPYHDLYSANQIKPLVREDAELEDAHPVYALYTQNLISKGFHDQRVRDLVIPAYMSLIKQCDDNLGRILDYLEETGKIDETMIVLTSDHGDYLGDHWMGEKCLFHDCSSRVPLIIYDPSEAADATRGTKVSALTEAIDLCATFIEVAGGKVPDHIVEGRSLLPFLHGAPPEDWRDAAFSEFDFTVTPMAAKLGWAPKDCRLFMVATDRWKMMHSEGTDRVMLFDLVADPDELTDLGTDPAYADVIEDLRDKLAKWALRCSQRVTKSDDDMIAMRGKTRRKGVVLGLYDGTEVEPELISRYIGDSKVDHSRKN